MLLAELPLAVVMQQRASRHPRWPMRRWSAVEVLPGDCPPIAMPTADERGEPLQHLLVRGLVLDLHPDEDEGYFENWAAPDPKVFVLWQMRGARALPVAVSVSSAEGSRMLDSGDGADGVPMPGFVHEWLGAYLAVHHRPRRHGGHRHA